MVSTYFGCRVHIRIRVALERGLNFAWCQLLHLHVPRPLVKSSSNITQCAELDDRAGDVNHHLVPKTGPEFGTNALVTHCAWP